MEEVVIQNLADTQKKFCIKTLTLEDIVNILTIAVELSRKLSNSYLLCAHLTFYTFAYMEHRIGK